MLKEFTMLKERRTMRLTYLRISLTHILPLLDGNKYVNQPSSFIGFNRYDFALIYSIILVDLVI